MPGGLALTGKVFCAVHVPRKRPGEIITAKHEEEALAFSFVLKSSCFLSLFWTHDKETLR